MHIYKIHFCTGVCGEIFKTMQLALDLVHALVCRYQVCASTHVIYMAIYLRIYLQQFSNKCKHMLCYTEAQAPHIFAFIHCIFIFIITIDNVLRLCNKRTKCEEKAKHDKANVYQNICCVYTFTILP